MRYFALVLFLSISFSSIAQSKNDSLAAVKALNTLIRLSMSGEHGKAAAYILYTGRDETRYHKVVSDYRKKEDRRLVDEFCMDIKKHLDCPKRTIRKFFIDNGPGGPWCVLEIACTYEDGEDYTTVAFLKRRGTLYLADLND